MIQAGKRHVVNYINTPIIKETILDEYYEPETNTIKQEIDSNGLIQTHGQLIHSSVIYNPNNLIFDCFN